MHSPLDVLIGVDNIEKAWDEVLTIGQKRAILAEVLTVTVLPTKSGGRAPDGSYFNQAAVRSNSRSGTLCLDHLIHRLTHQRRDTAARLG